MVHSCLVCGSAVTLKLFRGVAGATVSFKDGSVQLLPAADVPALCDTCFVVWSTRKLAVVWLYVETGVYRIGLSAKGFAMTARAHGLRPKTLKKWLKKYGRELVLQERRAYGSHDWAIERARSLLFMESPWAGAALGLGGMTAGVIGYLYGMMLPKEAA